MTDAMNCDYPQIGNEAAYIARLAQLDALVDCVMEYENRVHPIEPPSLWARLSFRWEQAWRWKIAPALVCVLLGALTVWLTL